MHPLVKSYLDQKFNFHLHKVQLKVSERIIASGNARLLVNNDGTIAFSFCGARHGDYFKEIAGATQFGILFEGEAGERSSAMRGQLYSGIYHMCASSFEVSLRASASDMQVVHRTSSRLVKNRLIGYLPAPSKSVFQENFLVKDNHSIFGDTWASYRWLAWNANGVECGFRSSENGMVEAYIDVPADLDFSNSEYISSAIASALSLRFGYRLQWIALVKQSSEAESILFNPFLDGFANNDFWSKPPVALRAFEDDTNQRFLACATQFFLSGPKINLDRLMGMFWEAALSQSFDIREMALGGAIEGLSEEIYKHFAPVAMKKARKKELKIRKKTADAILLQIEEEPKLAELPYFDSIKKSIIRVPSSASKDTIRVAAGLVSVSVSEEDIDCWYFLRNHAMHASHVKSEVDKDRQQRFERTTVLLHKLVFGLIGYHGPFIDYSKTDSQDSTLTITTDNNKP